MKIPIIIFSLILNTAHAELVGFCFDRSVGLADAKGYLNTILAPGDRIYKRESFHCLEVKTAKRRKELYDKWLRRRFRLIRTYDESSANALAPSVGISQNCTIDIEKKSSGSGTTDSVGISKSAQASSDSFKEAGTTRWRLLLGEGRKGHIEVNGQKVALICQPRGAHFVIDVEVITASGSLGSSVTVKKNQRVDLAGIVDDINRKTNRVDVNKGLDYIRAKAESRTNYFLFVR